jgi:hypothetical protein
MLYLEDLWYNKVGYTLRRGVRPESYLTLKIAAVMDTAAIPFQTIMIKQIVKFFWQLWGNSQLMCCPETYFYDFPENCDGCPWSGICGASSKTRVL